MRLTLLLIGVFTLAVALVLAAPGFKQNAGLVAGGICVAIAAVLQIQALRRRRRRYTRKQEFAQ